MSVVLLLKHSKAFKSRSSIADTNQQKQSAEPQAVVEEKEISADQVEVVDCGNLNQSDRSRSN
jgi:hypothetical protein